MQTKILKIFAKIFAILGFLILENFGASKSLAAEITLQDYVLKYEVILDSLEQKSITIKWQTSADTKRICIAKKEKNDTNWGDYVFFTFGDTINQWKDTNVKIGIEYEYGLEQYKDSCAAFAYFSAGIDVPLQEFRGTLLLLVDSSMQESLAEEIKQLEQNIIGDSWKIITKYVPRAENFDKTKVQEVKDLIKSEFAKDSTIRSLLLLGRVPVPYSGNYAIDGHIPEHFGAWGSDSYYQSLAGNWTDESLADTIAADKRNWNLQNDGKFDNDLIPTDLHLECGRIDFYNLPAFNPLSETELLKRYLNQNHKYRNAKIIYPQRAILNDYFGLYPQNEAIASNGWLNLIPLVGLENIDTLSFRSTLPTEKYLFSYACGGGGYESCDFAAYTNELAENGYNSVFSMLFGSYFGDWDSKNNLMRAMLAASPPVLTCSWAGRPYWFIHQLGMGENIGFSALLTQNNSSFGTYISNSRYGHRGTYVALLGDPTLRMHVINPVKSLAGEFVNPNFSNVNSTQVPYIFITWEGNSSAAGYNIYRAKTIYDKFEKLNSELLTECNFADTILFVGKMVYQVRAVEKSHSKTGSYWNQSVGKFINVSCLAEPENKNFSAYLASNVANNYFTLVVSSKEKSNLRVEMFDINGRNYGEIFNSQLDFGNNIFTIKNNLFNVAAGKYYLKLESPGEILVLPIIFR